MFRKGVNPWSKKLAVPALDPRFVVKTLGPVERGFNDLRCAKAAKCESQASPRPHIPTAFSRAVLQGAEIKNSSECLGYCIEFHRIHAARRNTSRPSQRLHLPLNAYGVLPGRFTASDQKIFCHGLPYIRTAFFFGLFAAPEGPFCSRVLALSEFLRHSRRPF